MKKAFFLILFLMISSHVYAFTDDGRTTHGPFTRLLIVEGRGIASLAASPLELIGTGVREAEAHPRVWPITYVPRFLTNFVARLISGVNDIVFYPFQVPFTDDLSPMTEPMGLPDYPWHWK